MSWLICLNRWIIQSFLFCCQNDFKSVFWADDATIETLNNPFPGSCLKGIYFLIYGVISEFTDKGQFQYLTNLKGPQEGTYLYTAQFLTLG